MNTVASDAVHPLINFDEHTAVADQMLFNIVQVSKIVAELMCGLPAVALKLPLIPMR